MRGARNTQSEGGEMLRPFNLSALCPAFWLAVFLVGWEAAGLATLAGLVLWFAWAIVGIVVEVKREEGGR
jgi:hypothetical protein